MKLVVPIRLGAVAALAFGTLLAQSTAPQPRGPGQNYRMGQMRGPMRGGMDGGILGMNSRLWAAALGLTDAQKAQAKTIFQEARDAARPVTQQLREARAALREAVKAQKSDAEIDALAANEGALLGKLSAIRTKAAAKFYGILTPEQQQKFDSLRAGPRPKAVPGV